MTKKINIYHTSSENLIKAACKILQKCYDNEIKISVYCPDSEMSVALDRTLWTFAQTSFIPHTNDNDATDITAPIQVTTQSNNFKYDNLMLINSFDIEITSQTNIFVICDNSQDNINIAKSYQNKMQSQDCKCRIFRQNKKEQWEEDQ